MRYTHAMREASWRIELFGTLTARRGAQVITRFRTRKTAAVLAYLAYYRDQAHPREALIELVWADADPEAGRHSLRTELNALRKQLEPEDAPGSVLRADRFTVQLNPEAITTDVAEFERLLAQAETSAPDAQIAALQQSLELYRGTFLAGYYEDWIVPQQLRLEEARACAALQLSERLERRGDAATALRWLTQAIAQDSQREELHLALIRLYATTGQTNAALRHYAKLEAALGEPPSLAAQEAIAAVRRSALVTPRVSAPPQAPASSPPQNPAPMTSPTDAPPRPNAPALRTRFFGRELEIAQLTEWLTTAAPSDIPIAKPLTLTGVGGSGKTRLALETIRRLDAAFPGAIWFVPLERMTDARLIPQAICDVMGLANTPHRSPFDQAAQALRLRPSLLALDNFEQLAETGGAEVVRSLLEAVPTLNILITSQRRLNLSGEREFPVAPLPTPGRRNARQPAPRSWEALQASPSVQLFCDRARSAHPAFQITRSNADAIAELCDRLEGIPLAIELAAARAAVLTPAQMLGQIADRFALLIGRARDVPERFRTLRAALDWSCDLLTPELRDFFERLAVFRGGWTAEDAAAVCLDSPEEGEASERLFTALDLLERLRERSLIQSEPREETMRFSMLETLREYAQSRLSQEAWNALSERAALRYLAHAERAEPEMHGGEQSLWIRRLDADSDNLRQALGYFLRYRPESALQMGVALRRFWYVRGYLSEGERWLEQALTQTEGASPSLRARAYNAMGVMARDRGDYRQANALYRQALALFQSQREEIGVAMTLSNLGLLASDQRDYAAACALHDEALALWRKLGDAQGQAQTLLSLGLNAQRQNDHVAAGSALQQSATLFRASNHQWGVASALQIWGYSLYALGRFAEAVSILEESLSLYRELGGRRGLALVFGTLGDVALARREADAAADHFAESLTLFQEIEDRWGVALSLQRYARLAYARGETLLAARWQGARNALSGASASGENSGAPLDAEDDPIQDFATLPDPEAALQAYRAGAALSSEQASAEALAYRVSKPLNE